MIAKKQSKLDLIKWNKSQEIKKDACGTFEFCVKCDKSLENPCHKAYDKFHKKAKSKNNAKLNGCEFRATVVEK